MRLGLIARGEDRGNVVSGMETCSIEGCDQPSRTRGWCSRHYQRWYNHGNPLAVKDNTGKPVLERFMEKVDVDDASGCWLWTATTNRKGYGMFWPTSASVSAHRWAYAHFVGPIPDGLQIDHLCRVRHCVNPEHLVPVTARENQQRSPFDPAARTHCPRGHPYDAENTYRYPDGRRWCRRCAAAARAAYKARKEQASCASA